MSTFKTILFALMLMASFSSTADRIKDFTDIAGVRSNKLIGFGLVVGLQGTGDGKDLPITAQALKTTLSGLGVSVDGPVSDFDLGDQLAALAAQNATKELKVDNVASVMVTAELPAFSKPGQRIDINVSAIGVAESAGQSATPIRSMVSPSSTMLPSSTVRSRRPGTTSPRPTLHPTSSPLSPTAAGRRASSPQLALAKLVC